MLASEPRKSIVPSSELEFDRGAANIENQGPGLCEFRGKKILVERGSDADP